MPALDALTLRAQLHEDFDSLPWRSYMTSMHDSLTGRISEADKRAMRARGQGVPLSDPSVDPNSTPEEFTEQMRRSLRLSETFYVAPTMNSLVAAAADQLRDDVTVEASEHGYHPVGAWPEAPRP